MLCVSYGTSFSFHAAQGGGAIPLLFKNQVLISPLPLTSMTPLCSTENG